jgi:hypothetical protein
MPAIGNLLLHLPYVIISLNNATGPSRVYASSSTENARKKEFLHSAQNDRNFNIADRANITALFSSKSVGTVSSIAPITNLHLTTYIYEKETKSQVGGEKRVFNAEKGDFVALDTWLNRTKERI